MLWFRMTLIIFSLATLNGGCEPYKPGIRPTSSSAISSDSTVKPKTLVNGGSLTDVIVTSNRLVAPGRSFQVIAKLGGYTTLKTPLISTKQGVKFQAIGLPVNKADVLTVEIYDGDTLKFIAKKAGALLSATSSAAVEIEDCQMLVAPWDGLKSEGGCNWSIEEAK